MKVEDLFRVRNGVPTAGLDILPKPVDGAIPFLRPASTQQRTISGWVARAAFPEAQVFPAGTLFVSTNGEGSHTYAYVASFEFACNSDVSTLVPRAEMSLPEKLFYARCITLNRFRFSYGRKPKGQRLRSVVLPNMPPAWRDAPLPALDDALSRITGGDVTPVDRAAQEGSAGLVPLEALFEVRYGHSLDLVSLERASDGGGVRFVSRAKRNNGVTARVKCIEGLEPNAGGELTCALNGEGGVLYTFLQDVPFYTAYHVACLSPRAEMTREELLFYAACIKANRFRYSYGRQANRTLRLIRVPSRESIPSWVYGALKRVAENVRDYGEHAQRSWREAAPSRGQPVDSPSATPSTL